MAIVTVLPLLAQWVLCFASVTRPSRYRLASACMHILLALLKRRQIRGSVSLTAADGRHTYTVDTSVEVTAQGEEDDVSKSSQPRMGPEPRL